MTLQKHWILSAHVLSALTSFHWKEMKETDDMRFPGLCEKFDVLRTPWDLINVCCVLQKS